MGRARQKTGLDSFLKIANKKQVNSLTAHKLQGLF